MGNPLVRRMKRTKREELRLIEGMNRDAVIRLSNLYNKLISEIVDFQRNFLAVINVLKKRGLIDDFSIHQELRSMEEIHKMEKEAIIIDSSKGEKIE